MLAATRPETLIVCTRDDAHDDHIVPALEAGIDVVTEKPMATTAEKVPPHARRRAPDRPARRRRLQLPLRADGRDDQGLLLAGAIGDIVSVDFHWYLDVEHGADYFRRWHACGEFRQPVRAQGDASFRSA